MDFLSFSNVGFGTAVFLYQHLLLLAWTRVQEVVAALAAAAVTLSVYYSSALVVAFEWVFRKHDGAKRPTYPAKACGGLSSIFFFGDNEWIIKCLIDNIVLTCPSYRAGRDAGISEVWTEYATVRSEQGPVRDISEDCDSGPSSAFVHDLGRDAAMLPSRGLRPVQFAPLASRQSLIASSKATRKVRILHRGNCLSCSRCTPTSRTWKP